MNAPTGDDSVAVVVDGHSTGSFLVDEFAARGLEVIHVQTGEYGAPALAHDLRYKKQLALAAGIRNVVEELEHWPVHCVVPGLEGEGVTIAEDLASALDLPGNRTGSASARRDKARMADALRAAGVRHIPHAVADDARPLVAQWSSWGKPTVMLKPPASAGSEDVIPCSSAEEIMRASQKILGKINACELPNESVLMQPLVTGEEYVVNAVSANGNHCVTDIWLCRKVPSPSGTPLDVYSDLIDSTSPLANLLTEYVFRVLDATDISWGASHSEIILSDSGPVLVEVGARLMGGSFDFNQLIRTGAYSQLETLVDAYVDPEQFDRKASRSYQRTHSVRTVDFQPTQSGVISGIRLDNIRSWDSYLMDYLAVGKGDVLAAPFDRNSHVGYVTLAHRDRDVVSRDYERLRQLEPTIFEVEREHLSS